MIIKRMWWSTPDHTYVGLIADSEEDSDLEIYTPYSIESILWEYVSAYPVFDIEKYVEPEPAVESNTLSPEQLSLIIDALEIKVPGLKNYISQNITQ